MAVLTLRLRRAGFDTASFAYVAALEKFLPCCERLRCFIQPRWSRGLLVRPYVVIGHSLGTVLLRSVLPQLGRAPAACFLIAPPTCACTLARCLAPRLPYRLLTGEMGGLLACTDFMRSLPLPTCAAWIYAGTAGPRARWYPLADEPNDGILKLSETRLGHLPLIEVPACHTYLMNGRALADDLISKARLLTMESGAPAERLRPG